MTPLYNIKKQDWAGKLNRGDSFRSTAIYQCEICLTTTNNWIMGGYPGWGPRLLCPADIYEEHQPIEERLKEKIELEEKIKNYEQITQKEPFETLFKTLYEEKKLLETLLKEGRALFFNKLNDLEGVDATAEVILYYPTSRYTQRRKLP